MKATGKMINNMEKVKRHGLTVLSMMEITLMARNMEREYSSGQTEQLIEEIFSITIFMGTERINGLMEESTLESGEIIRCMETVFSNGAMAGDMKVVMWMTKKRAKVTLSGLMAESILEVGSMGNSMAEEHILRLITNEKRVSGKMARELSG